VEKIYCEKMNRKLIVILLCTLFTMACKREFAEIQYGKEACDFCKMTIMDNRYAAEMVDEKGKVFKFDDVACMKHYITENKLSDAKAMLFVADFKKDKGAFLDARNAVYLHHEHFKSPMNGNYGAFASADDAKGMKDSLGAEQVTWEKL
jgi:copper chaperone NosL